MIKKLTCISCLDNNGIIGINNNLPWHIPEEMNHFKKYTYNKTVIMGGNTFYSIKYPLEGRTNVVISSDSDKFFKYIEEISKQYSEEGRDFPSVVYAENLNQFFECNLEEVGEELICIGGSEMYKSILPYSTNLVLTKLNRAISFDKKDKVSYFPGINFNDWEIENKEDLISSIGINLGIIFYFKKKNIKNNVYDIFTKKKFDIEDYYRCQNNI